MALTDYLIDNPDAILDLINQLGFLNISHNRVKNEVRFSKEEGSNPTAVCLNLNNLYYTCFSTNERGNLYTLAMKKKNLSFPQSLDYVASKLGLSKKQFKHNIKLPFDGFYKGILKQLHEPEYSMKTYDNNVLDAYINKYNIMFLNDGISFETQKEFQIGFDLETLRITIPIWTFDGQLCGIMGRLNDKFCNKADRWLPIIPCSRSLTLYGYHKNYSKIQEKGLVVIGESEKFVQQMHSMSSGIGLATGGCDISPTQAKYIKGLMVPKIILAYDEGLDEDQVRGQAKKLLVDNCLLKNQVGYVWDSKNEILPKGSKMSPTDLGKEAFKTLIKHKVRWLE